MPAPAIDLEPMLASQRVLGLLPPVERTRLAGSFVVEHFEAGATVATPAALPQRLGLVLQGPLWLQRGDDERGRVALAAGEIFGAGGWPLEQAEDAWVQAAGPARVAFLPVAEVIGLRDAHPPLALLMPPPAAAEEPPASGGDPHLNLMTTPVRSLLRREPVTLPPTATIAEAARTMRDQRVSSVLLIERGHLLGVVTDRDLRNRALAAGLEASLPVVEIATVAPLTVGIEQPAFEALLLMARHNIHHVPVLDGARVAGMITATDVTEQHSTSAVYLAGEVYKQASVEGLVAAAGRVRQLQRNLAAADASAYSTGHIVTAITDALTVRLLQLAEARFGPAPVNYAWVAAGSQARHEQTARSDQDNCMVLDDAYDEKLHGEYFRALAGFVNDGLDACGYIYCPGDMMARTDAWRQPRRRWAEYFRRWTQTPEPKALMLTSVFFDLRHIHGSAELLSGLRREVLAETRDNRIFLAHLVGNALTHRPPLSMFGGLSTVRHGQSRQAIDLKHSGVVPVVDLARVYALAGGHEAVNTHDRLMVAAQGGEISERSAHDLRDALEFMAALRIRHQAAQTARGEAPDNFVSLPELSGFERSQLKDAFSVVQTLQSVLTQRYR